MRREILDEILAARAARRSIARLVRLSDGAERLVAAADDLAIGGAPFGGDATLGLAVARALVDGDGGLVESAAGPVFVQAFVPSPRLAIVGAVHIAQSLAAFARDLGHAVLVVDPRRGFLTGTRFPDVEISHAWPDEALEAYGLDARTAVVTLSHDSKLDDPALHAALRSPAYYVGALGSRRTQARRRARLAEAGFDETAIARIHGPVGLDIGAGSPTEIALSIAAEIVACLRKRA